MHRAIHLTALSDSKFHHISSVHNITSANKEKEALRITISETQTVPLGPQLTVKLIALKNLNQPETKQKLKSDEIKHTE